MKCHFCKSCFQVFWVDGVRYYYCFLCKEFWKGRDDNLIQCEDPRKYINIPVEIKEQDET